MIHYRNHGPARLPQKGTIGLLWGVAIVVLVPLAIRMVYEPDVLSSINHRTTIAAVVLAHLAGLATYRRLGIFPGVAGAGTILPSFAISYGLILTAVLLLRLDYSRFQAGGSFICSVACYFIGYQLSRTRAYQLAVVPGGRCDYLEPMAGVEWNILSSPERDGMLAEGVVVDLRSNLSEEWERFIADCALMGRPVYHIKQVLESITGRVEIEHLSENTLGSVNPNQAYIGAKLFLDRLLALIVLCVFGPLLLLIAFAIRMESPGPAVFRQKRKGYRGKVFTVYKFRTMRHELHSESSNERERVMTRSGDTRITRLGRFLRRSRVDELPQILNILRGEMSWIGPRPEATALSSWYERELAFYSYRHIVRPGITGWAQVSQGHVTEIVDVKEKLHYDFYYIKNFSPWLDICVAMRTIGIILNGFGAR